jgi:MerR family mercuric resistance operon transcriptional regulator
MCKPNISSAENMTIGVLARTAGIYIEPIRYYQRIGMITEPPKPQQGHRQYPADLIEWTHFIERAQELGFSLAEIADLLSLNERECQEARIIADIAQ